MFDPAVLGTALIGIEAVRKEQELDGRPRRRASRGTTAVTGRIRHVAAASLRWAAELLERTPAATPEPGAR